MAVTVATKKKSVKKKVLVKRGDHMRVIRGDLRGATGTVQKIETVTAKMLVLEVRQLNGNIIRLPRSHWEYASRERPSIE